MSTAPATVDGPLLTADGVPLKASLEKSLRRNRLRALLLVTPPLLFLIFLFVIPIGNMLTRSVDDNLINDVLPRTFEAFEAWDKESEPSEAMFEEHYGDVFTGPEAWRAIDVSSEGTYGWEDSTYIKQPPFFTVGEPLNPP